MPNQFVFPDVHVDATPEGRPFSDAEIIARGVEQGGPSFEVRVFLNNEKADADTPADEQHGYAGSFHIYGFGLDKPGETPKHKIPTDYVVPATRAVRAALQQSPALTVTLVPRYYSGPATASRDLHLDGISIATR